MRCLCENSEAKLDCNMCPARIGDTPSIKARARAMDSKWIRWGRRCIFKCSRRKPPQHRSSPPKLLIQFTAWVCALLFFESVYCRPPACLFQGIYLNGFRTKTRLFRDKGFYRLAPHDDFYWRRRNRLTGTGDTRQRRHIHLVELSLDSLLRVPLWSRLLSPLSRSLLSISL